MSKWTWGMALMLAACGPEGGTEGGLVELPLVTSGADGASYRLVDAVFRIEGVGEAIHLTGDGEGLFLQDLPPGAARLELTGPWRLERRDARGWHPAEARLLSPASIDVRVDEGDHVALSLRFDTAAGQVTFGQ